MAQQRIEALGKEGEESVVLEAAVLLEAGWDDMCDELWVVQVPPAVARCASAGRVYSASAPAIWKIITTNPTHTN